ncbi:type VI secretion system protein TssA [Lysobacter enzymogenes]|uniref:type VI secretion system protein TssA n=1 Tax=Lysobacter enzymogenes TaxID=69 RepID=UPI001AF54C0F|nr:type VI secretion system protein TssA [Lysobacter enzymogenes]QQQ03700.1 type VI secretion system protein TssA [Lysobacter enzymogenes]
MSERLLQPLDGDEPCGPNLEYDPDFQTLEELAEPRPERTLGAGTIASEPIEWQRIADQADALLQRSKDLRVAVHWCAARLHLDGVAGWAQGVALMRALLEHHWDSVHPRLDPSENDDPTERINAVAGLADNERMLSYLRGARLFRGSHPAHFSLRELRIAQGTLKIDPADAAGLPGLSAMEACLRECPLQELSALDAALAGAIADLGAMADVFGERTSLSGPDFAALLRELRELRAFVHPALLERDASAAVAEAASADDGAATAPAASGRQGIERPEDVRRAIDQICDYYARVEPSSPVPLLLRRAQRLVGLDFAGLMRDLAPDGISQLQVISGQNHDD